MGAFGPPQLGQSFALVVAVDASGRAVSLYLGVALWHLIIPSNPISRSTSSTMPASAPFPVMSASTRSRSARTPPSTATPTCHYLHHKYFEVNYGDGAHPARPSGSAPGTTARPKARPGCRPATRRRRRAPTPPNDSPIRQPREEVPAVRASHPARAGSQRRSEPALHPQGRKTVKKLFISTALAALMSTSAMAAKIGVSIVNFDNNFQTLLRDGMQARAKEKGAGIQVEDAQNDVAKQLDQIKNFIASGVDAIIVNPVDTNRATQAMSRKPPRPASRWSTSTANRSDMSTRCPRTRPIVGSNEVESGTLETQGARSAACSRKPAREANVYVIMGEPRPTRRPCSAPRTSTDVIAHADIATSSRSSTSRPPNWYARQGAEPDDQLAVDRRRVRRRHRQQRRNARSAPSRR